ncbi:allophanate hydrolase subunit 1 [Vibrio sp. CAU 1672]|uniref:5-oxoprolinase subunit B family protein n=1 Tax=Vibrio sp. CAU 1672 TaxID=3032594 RepID=UPI0023DAF68C|nr:allophanate hydrolase subunit 1 [Vibrio sp. CAU 1672]MDF2154787.1 allophanate hydrolase subunit 1 [Vibrio sp. CAU 1672]
MKQGLFKVSPISECTLLVSFEPEVSVEDIGQLAQLIGKQFNHVVLNVIPSYQTILVDYLPYRLNELTMITDLNDMLGRFEVCSACYKVPVNHLTIPVFYSEETALDLGRFAAKGLSLEDLIVLHTQPVYTVSAIGFAPGFAFLSDVEPSLHMPRLDTPRTQVPAGSVAIADSKTAVYPCDSPGGWNIIGRSPVSFFSDQPPYTSFQVGDKVTFAAIDKQEFLSLGGVI